MNTDATVEPDQLIAVAQKVHGLPELEPADAREGERQRHPGRICARRGCYGGESGVTPRVPAAVRHPTRRGDGPRSRERLAAQGPSGRRSRDNPLEMKTPQFHYLHAVSPRPISVSMSAISTEFRSCY